MNILPEWLSGTSNLNTENPIYLWVKRQYTLYTEARFEAQSLTRERWIYIVFFNSIWVLFPVWVLKETYTSVNDAFMVAEETAEAEYALIEEKKK